MNLEVIIGIVVAGTAVLGIIAKLLHHTIFKPMSKLDSKVSDIEQENTRTGEKLSKLADDIKDVKSETERHRMESIDSFKEVRADLKEITKHLMNRGP